MDQAPNTLDPTPPIMQLNLLPGSTCLVNAHVIQTPHSQAFCYTVYHIDICNKANKNPALNQSLSTALNSMFR